VLLAGQPTKRARRQSPELLEAESPDAAKDKDDEIFIEKIKAKRKSLSSPVFGRTSQQTDWKS